MEISVGPSNLAGIFHDQKTTSVPNFQRNYSWGATEIDPFLQDLFTAANDDQSHFFGPIVLLTQKNSRLLVDGQQRITTAVMCLAILRDFIHELPIDERTYESGGASFDLMQYRAILFDSIDLNKPKFESNYQLRDLFYKGVLVDPSSPEKITFTKAGAGLSQEQIRVTKELRAGYLRLKNGIYKWLRTGQLEHDNRNSDSFEIQRARIQRLYQTLTGGFGIHSMILNNEEDAFVLFETLNERGLKLSPADLLKTLIMKEVLSTYGEKKLETVLTDWDQTNSNVGEYPYSKFLRHHLLTLESEPVQMKRVFGIFKSRVVGKGEGVPLQELTRIKKSSGNYKLLLESNKYSHLNAISETHRVLLLGVLNNIADHNANSKLIDCLVRATEYLAFRWIVCGQNAQILETKYQELAGRVSLVNSTDGLEKFIEEIRQFAPNDIEFKNALNNLESQPLQKFLLRRVEAGLNGQHAWDDNLTLEHLAPQNPDGSNSNWKIHVPDLNLEEIIIDYSKRITSLGNLTLLERGLNSQIQNFNWDIKVGGQSGEDGYKGLDASSCMLNKSLVDIPQWNGDLIISRGNYLVEAALKLFSIEWIKTGKSAVSAFDTSSSS